VPVEADPPAPAVLVERALEGDRAAWDTIVTRYQGVAWKVAATFDLPPEDRNDVFASTFFRLFERLSTIREPEKLPGWIATTARNEALTLLRARSRQRPSDPHIEGAAVMASSDEGLLDQELRVAVRVAFADLPDECRQLLLLMTADPPLSYDEIAALTGRPRGSLGPTRQRCLDRLRRSPALLPFLDEGAP
jgi:RNA polymerase sigma factor (sigma-70 family)